MTVLTSMVDTDLVRSVADAAAGDEVAFARIVAAHHEDMRRVCVVVTGDPHLWPVDLGYSCPAWQPRPVPLSDIFPTPSSAPKVLTPQQRRAVTGS
jgi:hypothetical protein